LRRLAALEAAKTVTPSGAVTGFDISVPLVGLATRRAAEAKVEHARFLAGDAQVDNISGGPFDAAMSQFGVMFFSDPMAAFANIRRHLRRGGRMAFACWQETAKNTWFPGPVLARYQPPPVPSAGGGPSPGPFAFADADYVRRVLRLAGFDEIRHEELVREVTVPEDSVADRETIESLRLDAERTALAWSDLHAFAESMRGLDGQLHLRIAPQLFAARNPA
jgi:ubiquinone/menaquinone biosynthesis C-methylase UbiE